MANENTLTLNDFKRADAFDREAMARVDAAVLKQCGGNLSTYRAAFDALYGEAKARAANTSEPTKAVSDAELDAQIRKTSKSQGVSYFDAFRSIDEGKRSPRGYTPATAQMIATSDRSDIREIESAVAALISLRSPNLSEDERAAYQLIWRLYPTLGPRVWDPKRDGKLYWYGLIGAVSRALVDGFTANRVAELKTAGARFLEQLHDESSVDDGPEAAA